MVRTIESFFDDSTVNIGESLIAATIPKRQSLMVDSELVQNRCMDVMNVDRMLNHPIAKVIGCTKNIEPEHRRTKVLAFGQSVELLIRNPWI